MISTPSPVAVRTASALLRLIAGLAVVYVAFHGIATALDSGRGEAGVIVGAVVVGLTLATEWLLYRRPLRTATRSIGLGRPSARGLIAVACIGLALVAVIPAYAAVTRARIVPYPGWPALLPGVFMQTGVAEEALFRGYLFSHIRRGRTFMRAAVLATLPFVAVHVALRAPSRSSSGTA